jgi:uncharacterized protein YndB with AHSA1/START domain
VAENPRISVDGTLHSVNGEGVVRLKTRFESDGNEVWLALTDPQRLAHWYGKVEGDLRDGGQFTAFVTASEWDGLGMIDTCNPPRRLEVTMWEVEDAKHIVKAELLDDGDGTILALEVGGLPLDLVWAYGAGWQVHLEDLGAHLSGHDSMNLPTRWDELEPLYRGMTVEPLSLPSS